MSEMIRGIRLVRVAPLDPDGGVPDAPTWHSITTPQQANASVVMINGQQTEIRGGDRLLAVITEDDRAVGIDVTFADAAFDLDALPIIDGGTLVGGEYTPRAMDAAHPRFVAEIYAARYGEGSSQETDIVGYTKITLPNCTGSLTGLNLQDRTAAAPQFTIRGRDNKTDNLRFVRFGSVASLPA